MGRNPNHELCFQWQSGCRIWSTGRCFFFIGSPLNESGPGSISRSLYLIKLEGLPVRWSDDRANPTRRHSQGRWNYKSRIESGWSSVGTEKYLRFLLPILQKFYWEDRVCSFPSMLWHGVPGKTRRLATILFECPWDIYRRVCCSDIRILMFRYQPHQPCNRQRFDPPLRNTGEVKPESKSPVGRDVLGRDGNWSGPHLHRFTCRGWLYSSWMQLA